MVAGARAPSLACVVEWTNALIDAHFSSLILAKEVRPRATPNTVDTIPTLGAIFPRGGPVQNPVLTHPAPRRIHVFFFALVAGPRQSLRMKLSDTRVY